MISLIKHHLTVMWSLLIFSVVMLMHNTFIAPLPLLKPSSSYASAAALEIISTRPTTLFITSSLSASTTPSTISLTKFFINANLSKYLQQLNHHQYQQQQYPAEYFSPSNNLFRKASFTSIEPAVDCYSCTFPRDWQCNALAALTTKDEFLRTCNESCSVLIGQDGRMGAYDESVTLTRDCHPIPACSSNSSICCQCQTSRCNVNNLCEDVEVNNTAIAYRDFHLNFPFNFWLWVSACMTLIVFFFRDF